MVNKKQLKKLDVVIGKLDNLDGLAAHHNIAIAELRSRLLAIRDEATGNVVPLKKSA